jgi:hypothetical protein
MSFCLLLDAAHCNLRPNVAAEAPTKMPTFGHSHRFDPPRLLKVRLGSSGLGKEDHEKWR